MDNEVFSQLIIGIAAGLIGLSGLLLPYEYNLLKLKGGFRRLFSDRVNKAIPKVIGSLLLIMGALIVIASLISGDLSAK